MTSNFRLVRLCFATTAKMSGVKEEGGMIGGCLLYYYIPV